MNYTQNRQVNTITDPTNFLHIPSALAGFTNTHSSQHTAVSGKSVVQFHGNLRVELADRACPNCGDFMHINNTIPCSLWHLNFGPLILPWSSTRNNSCAQPARSPEFSRCLFRRKDIGFLNHSCSTPEIFLPSEPITSSKSLRLLALA